MIGGHGLRGRGTGFRRCPARRTASRCSWFRLTPARHPARSALVTADSRGYADIEFDGVRVGTDALLGTLDGGFPLLDAVLDRARAGLAAEMLGTAAQSFDMTLEYLKTRKQFGRVIGSFQALGHRGGPVLVAWRWPGPAPRRPCSRPSMRTRMRRRSRSCRPWPSARWGTSCT
ncbi:MAG: acyl-CoA dehydrogenase family protein [Gammaproteobacteria bacterium]|nr:acyl-CoA dehydrogenase family protein [Gammaproteobacteria bacterium]